MIEYGEPSVTLQTLGISRSELEGSSGKTVLIYTGEQMTIVVPDSIDFTSLNIIAKTRDISLSARDINIVCNSITVLAATVDITADVTITGNFTTQGGIVNLN